MENRFIYSLEVIKAVAEERGGKCLSKKFENSNKKMRFKCEHEHIFYLTPSKLIKQGSWCYECHQEKYGKRLEDKSFKKIVKEKKGKVLFPAVVDNSAEKVYLECRKGHIFSSRACDIRKKWSCPKCREENKIKDYIKKIKKIVKEKRGSLLTTEIKTLDSKVQLVCNRGHFWITSVESIIKKKTWCHQCRKNTIEMMQEFAKKRGGECLSKEYVNSHSHLIWKCEHGHTWKAQPLSITNSGTWCPVCSKNKQKWNPNGV